MTRVQGSLMVLGSGLIFSIGALAYAGARETSSPQQYLVYRCGSVAVVAACFLLTRHGTSAPAIIRAAGRRHAMAGLILGTMFMLFIVSLSKTDTATTIFLQAAAPFSAATLGLLIMRERVARDTWIAMSVAVVGIAVMVATKIGGDDLFGVLTAACIPVLMGLYTVLIRSRSDADPNVSVLIAGTFAMTAAGIVALATDGLGVSTHDFAFACLGGGVSLGVALPLYNLGSRVVPAAEMTLLILTEVVFAPIWVWIWPGERPATLTLVGGGIVLGAVIWLALRARTNPAIRALQRTGNRSTL